MKRILFSTFSLVAAFTLLPAVAAHASCAAPPPLEDAYARADVVFTGTVTATEGRDRIATVRVGEVWKGSPLPGSVEVRGGPGEENIATSVDRHFEVGVRYLFFPNNRKPPFKDNICSSTRPYRAALERLREDAPPGPGPASPGEGAPIPFTGTDPSLGWLLAGLLGTVGILLVVADRRKREPGP